MEDSKSKTKIVRFFWCFLVSAKAFLFLLLRVPGAFYWLSEGTEIDTQHISHPIHKKKIGNSKCEQYIHELCSLAKRPTRMLKDRGVE